MASAGVTGGFIKGCFSPSELRTALYQPYYSHERKVKGISSKLWPQKSQQKSSLPKNTKGFYQIEFSDLHQLLSIQSDLLHVNGDGEHRVGATAGTTRT